MLNVLSFADYVVSLALLTYWHDMKVAINNTQGSGSSWILISHYYQHRECAGFTCSCVVC